MITSDNGLVSVIMPTYNSEEFIKESIQSVINQTYTNWELLIVDDASNDNTVNIIEKYIEQGLKIKLKVLVNNSGAAIARNTAVEKAEGKYLAFLDSDDLWDKDKLKKQISFMEKNGYTFTSTDFIEVVDADVDGKITRAHKQLDYMGLLKYCPGNSTVVYNQESLGKFFAPDIKKRNDFAMWLQVIKKSKYLYGMPEILTTYRIRPGSLSGNKVDLVKYQWMVFRDLENLSISKSLYLLGHKTLSVLLKKLNIKFL